VIKLDERACLELFENYKTLGRITIRDGKKTLAAGIITEIIN
jgi:translation elongation factor EF-1alpha